MIAARCVNCGGNVLPRRTEEGYPRGSIALMNRDPRHFFCTWTCAARYGIRMAESRIAGAGVALTVERHALIYEDQRRAEISRRRKGGGA